MTTPQALPAAAEDDPFVLDRMPSAPPPIRGAELVPIPVVEPEPAPRPRAAGSRYSLDTSASDRRALYVFTVIVAAMFAVCIVFALNYL